MATKQEKEILKHLEEASLQLNAASAIAQKMQDFSLVEKIVAIAKQSERLEVNISGEPICRKEHK